MKPGRVREPVQVYLDERDRALLDAVAERAAVPRSEVLRMALRRLAAELPAAERPGAGLASLVGSLDASPAVPADLAARHDEYLYPRKGKPARKNARKRR